MDDLIINGMTLAGTAGITEFVKVIVNTYLKPKFESLLKEEKVSKDFLDLIEVNFSEYLSRSYKKNLYMNTIVFRNSQKTIDELYIPLTVEKVNIQSDEEYEKVVIDEFSDDFIPKYNKVLLIDNAGMGKSTIIKKLYLSTIEKNKGLPILIELRKLKKDISIVDFIISELNGISKSFNKDYILKLIEKGDFIFFFDGYDEVEEAHKRDITENLQDFIFKANNNMFLLSSRDDNSLNCFGDFQSFQIKKLEIDESYSLIRKYDKEGESSKELISKLETEANLRIIEEFLVNPLMTSLLYKAFEYKHKIPYSKHIFYKQVYDALFEDHNKTKSGLDIHIKKSKLGIEDFHRVLRAIGFYTIGIGKISYSSEELLEIINKVKKITSDLNFKDSDFKHDIINSVPLFVKDGIDFRWTHKSFQEYFAASYICNDSKQNQEKYLLQMVENEKINKYYNVIDFCYDMDIKEFRKTIIYPMVDKFIKYYEGTYTNEAYTKYNIEDIRIRKGASYIYDEIYVIRFEDENLFDRMFGNNVPFSEPDELYNYIFSNWKAMKKSNRSLNIHNLCIGIGGLYKEPFGILEILFNKKLPVLKRIKFDNIAKYANDVSLIEVGEYFVDDNPENELNSPEYFATLNYMLLGIRITSGSGNLIFDYEECIKLKNEIDEEKKQEEKNLFIL